MPPSCRRPPGAASKAGRCTPASPRELGDGLTEGPEGFRGVGGKAAGSVPWPWPGDALRSGAALTSWPRPRGSAGTPRFREVGQGLSQTEPLRPAPAGASPSGMPGAPWGCGTRGGSRGAAVLGGLRPRAEPGGLSPLFAKDPRSQRSWVGSGLGGSPGQEFMTKTKRSGLSATRTWAAEARGRGKGQGGPGAAWGEPSVAPGREAWSCPGLGCTDRGSNPHGAPLLPQHPSCAFRLVPLLRVRTPPYPWPGPRPLCLGLM